MIVVMLAGLVAEEVILGSRSTLGGGSRDADLIRATRLANGPCFTAGTHAIAKASRA